MVEIITKQAKEAFQLEIISLVQSNRHHVENSDTTGLQLWKSPARKVYAIRNIPAPEAGSTELIKQMGRKN